MKKLVALALLAPLAGCATLFGDPRGGAEQTLKLGQSGDFGPVNLTPISVDEDSRCPVSTQCIWAGRVRVKVLVEPAGANYSVFATLGQPMGVDGGTLLLEQASPERTSAAQTPPSHYRFTIRYTPPA
jgi:hypothetical protein